jgi:hypothetical protein
MRKITKQIYKQKVDESGNLIFDENGSAILIYVGEVEEYEEESTEKYIQIG